VNDTIENVTSGVRGVTTWHSCPWEQDRFTIQLMWADPVPGVQVSTTSFWKFFFEGLEDVFEGRSPAVTTVGGGSSVVVSYAEVPVSEGPQRPVPDCIDDLRAVSGVAIKPATCRAEHQGGR
jgi:hypothetical protein